MKAFATIFLNQDDPVSKSPLEMAASTSQLTKNLRNVHEKKKTNQTNKKTHTAILKTLNVAYTMY